MVNEYIVEGTTVEDAIAEGIAQSGLSESEVDIEVLDEGSKKHFGFGSAKPARVKVTPKNETNAETETEVEDEDEPEALEPSEIAAPIIEEESEAISQDYNNLEIDDLSDDQIDSIADEAIDAITKIAKYCGANNIEIDEYEGDEGEVILDIVGEDLAFLIGRHGRTIEALQTVTSAIVTKKVGIRYPITVDVEGYRHRRKQKVIEIANKAADRALRSGRPVSLRPMSPQERRIVHIAIRELVGVTSTSEGVGDSRHVVVIPS